MDPLTVAVIAAGAHAVIQLANAHAETKASCARIELVRTVAELPPGTEINSGGDSVWLIRIPALTQESPETLQQTDNGDGVNV